MQPEETGIAWSTYVQRPESLYKTRSIRFRDEDRHRLLDILHFRNGMKILEVGCGPGAFCFALKRWLPDSLITGLDRDTNFIDYARRKAVELDSDCCFVTGDALKLDFPDNTFDAVTSHTVVEHVETRSFLAEQHRVLKPGGICTVLSVRTSFSINPDPWHTGSEEEKALWDRVDSYFRDFDRKFGVAGYSISESALAEKLVETGFRDVSVHFLVNEIIPDNADVNSDTATAMIEALRQVKLDGVVLANALAPGELSEAETGRFIELIKSHFDRRLQLYEIGEKVWDISASVMIIGRGYR